MVLTSGRSCLSLCLNIAQLDDLRTSNGLNGTSHDGKGDKELGDLHFEKVEWVGLWWSLCWCRLRWF